MRTAINAAVIEDGKILLVRKRKTWILPGGKPEPRESDLECLCRELDEELSGLKIKNLKYYNEFEGIAPHKKDLIKVKVYLAQVEEGPYKPSREINAAELVEDTSKYNISDITLKIIESLKKDYYI